MFYDAAFYTRSLVALSMIALCASCGSPDLNPKYMLPHVAFEVPIQGLASTKTYSMHFSTTHPSERYRLFLSFANTDPDSLETQKKLVRLCLERGQASVIADSVAISEENADKGQGFSMIDNERLSAFPASDLTLESGQEYKVEVQFPQFSEACQALEPFLLLGIGPEPSL